MNEKNRTLLLLHLAVFLAGSVVFLSLCVPVYRILFAALLFGETREVGWSFWAGIALIVLSVWLQTRRVRRRA